MYTVKGGWVGQTFALARGNDSEGRKTRIRRSKEERKAMVESFIKKYQKSNNGSFPSLNLTHKEVGGSFYTVREIVRDIIQENRVLGPAKLSPGEESSYQFLEQDPLFLLTAQPQTPPETHLLLNHHEDAGEKQELGSDGHYTGSGNHTFDNVGIINGSLVDVENKRPDGPTREELLVSKPSEEDGEPREELAAPMVEITPAKAEEEQVVVSDGNFNLPEHQVLDNGQIVNESKLDVKDEKYIELKCTEFEEGKPSESERDIEEKPAASKAKVNPITADVMVEVFPIRPVTNTTDSFDGILEAKDLDHSSEEKEIETAVLELGNGSFLSNGMNSKKNSNLDDDLAESSIESVDCSTHTEVIKHKSQGVTVLEAKVCCNEVGTTETFEKTEEPAIPKAVNAGNGTHTNILNGVYSGSSSMEVNTPEAVLNEPKANVQCGDNSQKGMNPTLDRINLESWEETTRRSAKPETNPIFATIRAFVAAFMKFWSE